MKADTNPPGAGKKILEINNLCQYFSLRGKIVKAVDGISLTIYDGETFGLVGESGCGKSTAARCAIRIYQPTAGEIILDGDVITNLTQQQLKPYRKKMQMIFQDPYSSLNSRMPVKDILMEPLVANKVGKNKGERLEMAVNALESVGLPAYAAARYPHEFSGGQRQRIGIARALIMRPKLVICDEPISALDVSIQAQVVNMLETFQRELGLAYLFIAHDLSMVRYVSHRVGVMYLGRLVEVCASEKIYANPLHPYTQALLESIPVPDPEVSKNKTSARIEGEVPSPINPPAGCHFHPRCSRASPLCAERAPQIKDMGEGHFVSCHLYT
ncbi:MAG: ATP-binding cassette domain-containing protein [Clostridiales bacterium]|jgi:oligopeptide transport system ATP-binding protein|nr:ATP-binding cassette domain-containing protein [Clostridiales bacterium]